MTDPAPSPAVARGAAAFTVFLVLATCVLCAVVLWQRRAIVHLQAEVLRTTDLLGTTALPVGEIVAPLEAFSADAPSTMLDYASAPKGTLLFIHTPGCGACEVMKPRLDALARLTAPTGIRFVGIQPDAAQPSDLKLDPASPFQELGIPQAQGTWLKRVVLVPSILYIDAAGTIRAAFYGSLVDAQWDKLQQVLLNPPQPAK